MKRKRISLALCIILLLTIVVFNFPFDKEINTTLPALQCRIGDKNYSQELSINIKGIYTNYIFKDDKFEGTISISNYAFTKETPILPITFSGGEVSLDYGSSTIYIKPLGDIICTPNFNKLLIIVSEPVGKIASSWNSSNALYICAPATTLAQAQQLAKSLSAQSKSLKYILWQ